MRYVYRIVNDKLTAVISLATRLDYRIMSSDLATRIQQRLSELGKSARGASLEAGLSDGFIRNILTGKSTSPRGDTLEKLAIVLGTSEAWLLRGEPAEIENSDRRERTKGFSPVIIPGEQLVSNDKKLPVYAAARGGDGHHIVTFDPIDYLKMPAVLQDVKGGYGLLLTGDSMVPAYWPGDTALVNPNLPPARDTDVVLYHTPQFHQGEEEAIIKRLVGVNDREWTLEQYRPERVFKESRADWTVCHRVVGKYNAR
ncbi:helix-turn-helix transcriptional regulator [Aminobacter sp. SR38]|jgi:phage repressor protein C with HTH and peptisase S24 domain|nr:helix-turn-helix transcriptional regulator [Aminobacter sp. SR38]